MSAAVDGAAEGTRAGPRRGLPVVSAGTWPSLGLPRLGLYAHRVQQAGFMR